MGGSAFLLQSSLRLRRSKRLACVSKVGVLGDERFNLQVCLCECHSGLVE